MHSDSHHEHGAKNQTSKTNRLATNKCKEHRKDKCQKRSHYHNRGWQKHRKNLSKKELTNDQINFLAKGLKFIPTPMKKRTQIRQKLLQFARRMCLMYRFQGKHQEPHPYHVKSSWKPAIQQSVGQESYLEEVKSDLADLKSLNPLCTNWPYMASWSQIPSQRP